MQGSNVSPQQALKTARAGLLTSLIAATKALESDDASPGLVAQALQGVVNAQIPYNNAVVRIPLSVMTDGYIPRDAAPENAQPEFERGLDAKFRKDLENLSLPEKLFGETNPRKWADWFLAEMKNQAVDREALVDWFGFAIDSGRYEGLNENQAAATALLRDPLVDRCTRSRTT